MIAAISNKTFTATMAVVTFLVGGMACADAYYLSMFSILSPAPTGVENGERLDTIHRSLSSHWHGESPASSFWPASVPSSSGS